MIIEKDIFKYTIFFQESIFNALSKIIETKGRVLFAVTESGLLKGLLTNGDFLRWVIQQGSIDLKQPVSRIMNQKFVTARLEDGPDKIKACLRQVRFVPVLDNLSRLIGVARKRGHEEGIRIGEVSIDAESPTFIIAEIGINHNGSLELAKNLIDQAVSVGADCAKFQLRTMEALYSNAGDANDARENLGSQYTLDLLTRFQLSTEEMYMAFDYCKAAGIIPLCTPWDLESLAILEQYGMAAYKVASPDLTNHDLVTAISKTGKPIICSTGMSTEQEIIESVRLLRDLGAQYVLLQCNSTYPAPFKDINLNYMEHLKEIGGCPTGYSGHERGINIAIAAVAKGAKVIEKHFSMDRSMEGNDHKISLLPAEFKIMVEGIRQVEQALGTARVRTPSQGEIMNRATLAKSLVINCDLEVGQVITGKMLEVKSPGKGLQPNRKEELIGLKAKRRFAAGDFFYPTDLVEKQILARNYDFNRPWGLAVRYHDFKTILAKTNPDFLEFHLSYKDLEQDIYQFFDQPYDLGLVVHSPDTFAGDHLLSLSHPDKEHRTRSVYELQRVIDITRKLKPFFGKAKRPFIVVSVGGFTRDRLLHASERIERYQLLAESLAQLDGDGVEIIPQTLPPFPWYFGGQLYLNLFVDPKDTVEFCCEHGYRVCLDISHAKLACNHFKWSFKEFVSELGPYAAHLHIADAEGIDGEGLQIGEGEIDFPALAAYLNQSAPQASFIPEIWQGHENEGEGFWKALERLEGMF